MRGAIAGAAPDSLTERSVVVGKDAYSLLPPELVCGPSAVQAKWSTDGRYILVVRRAERVSPSLGRTRALARDPGEPPGDLSLVVWHRDSLRSREVWRRPLGSARVEAFHWLPESDCAIAIVVDTLTGPGGQRSRREMLWMRADSGLARAVAEVPFDQTPTGATFSSPLNYVDISPRKPIALIVNSATGERKMTMTDGTIRTLSTWQYNLTPIRDNGSPAPTVRLPVDVTPVAWSESGSTYYLEHEEWLPDRKQKPVRTHFEFNPRTGQVQRLPAEPPNLRNLVRPVYAPGQGPDPDRDPEAARRPIILTSAVSEVRQDSTAARVGSLWLEAAEKSDQPRALVSADAAWSRLSPSGDAVLYFSQRAAWVRPILRVSVREYEAMLKEELRRQAVADAGELARALLNLVESSEYFPKPDQLSKWLAPSLKDKSLLDRLVYTHGGGVGLGLENAASIQLGYVNGPGGRAVLFADGHVAWQDD